MRNPTRFTRAAMSALAPTAGPATFCVILVDTAGHAGPGDCTAAVTIVP